MQQNSDSVPDTVLSAADTADSGRGPTPEEEAAADRSADDVDLDRVGDHEREMLETGANVRGEGQIDPQ